MEEEAGCTVCLLYQQSAQDIDCVRKMLADPMDEALYGIVLHTVSQHAMDWNGQSFPPAATTWG
jgi:hypothetical protein